LTAQAQVIAAIEASAGGKPSYGEVRNLLKLYEDDDIYDWSFGYLLSCLKSRITHDTPIYIIVEYDADDFLPAFQPDTQAEVLRRIGDMMVPEFLADDSYKAIHYCLRALQEVIRWARLLLELDAEPKAPKLKDKTELHRAFRDFILIHPTGAFRPAAAAAAASSNSSAS
jgi:hypothetical protein